MRESARSVATVHVSDHDLVAAPFADRHLTTVVSSISPVIVVTISPIVVVAIIIATFTVGALAVGSDTDIQLSERDRRFGRDSITSVFGRCRKSPHYARDGGDKRQFCHSNLLLTDTTRDEVNKEAACLFVRCTGGHAYLTVP